MFVNSQNCNVAKHLFSESEEGLIFSPKTLLFLSKRYQKQPYNWVMRFTLVIIINNVCVSKCAYAVVTIFKWDTENIIYFIYRYVMLPNKIEND